MQQGMPLSVQAQAQTLGVRMSTLQHVLQAPRQRDTALTHPADGSDGLEHLPDTESPAPDAHAEHASLRVLLSDLLDLQFLTIIECDFHFSVCPFLLFRGILN